jgi:hypothetical protein
VTANPPEINTTRASILIKAQPESCQVSQPHNVVTDRAGVDALNTDWAVLAKEWGEETSTHDGKQQCVNAKCGTHVQTNSTLLFSQFNNSVRGTHVAPMTRRGG